MIKFGIETAKDLKDLIRKLSVGLAKLATEVEKLRSELDTLKDRVDDEHP
jgi:uncharacterized coiled-coil protein SlyX